MRGRLAALRAAAILAAGFVVLRVVYRVVFGGASGNGILIVDLRILGFLRHISMRSALSFLPFVIIGFVINLLTGILFFAADPMMYWPSPAFKLKMFLILLAGLNALVFTLVEHRHALVLGEDDQATKFMKVSAGLSLSFWLLVLLLGRLLPAFEGSTSFF